MKVHSSILNPADRDQVKCGSGWQGVFVCEQTIWTSVFADTETKIETNNQSVEQLIMQGNVEKKLGVGIIIIDSRMLFGVVPNTIKMHSIDKICCIFSVIRFPHNEHKKQVQYGW